jgi:hypothetical protein
MGLEPGEDLTTISVGVPRREAPGSHASQHRYSVRPATKHWRATLCYSNVIRVPLWAAAAPPAACPTARLRLTRWAPQGAGARAAAAAPRLGGAKLGQHEVDPWTRSGERGRPAALPRRAPGVDPEARQHAFRVSQAIRSAGRCVFSRLITKYVVRRSSYYKIRPHLCNLLSVRMT